MAFNATIDLLTLDSGDGFRIVGWEYGQIFGRASGVGDFNGDGIADLFVASPYGFDPDVNGVAPPRSGYIVFGRNAAVQGAGPQVLDVRDLDADTGVTLRAEWANDGFGRSMTPLGDINGDGFDDVLIGALKFTVYNEATQIPVGPLREGRAYVLFGRDPAAGAGAAEIDVTDLDGTNGFAMGSGEADTFLGMMVSGIGDINGDGLNDLLLTRYHGFAGTRAYVVFGKDAATQGAFSPFLDLNDLDGSDGFAVVEIGPYARVLVGAADINHDGIDDLVLGQGEGGGVRVVFGRDTATVGDFAASYTFAQFAAEPGLSITGGSSQLWAGMYVASAGDVNGDGIDDLIVSATFNFHANPDAPAGAWIVFGRDGQGAGGFGAVLDLDALDGTDGFRIYDAGQIALGAQIDALGDINGDGFDDISVGSAGFGIYGLGQINVVFGAATFAPVVPLSGLNGRNGFTITGEMGIAGHSDWTLILNAHPGAAGDVNGDGIDDLMVTAVRQISDTDSLYEVHVIYGRADRTASAAGGVLNGGFSGDRLTGGIGNDVLNGLAGDDELDGGDKGDILNGGDGVDKLYGGAGGDVLNGDAGDDQLVGGADGDKLFGGAGDDYLGGGTGNDRMEGGDGADALEGNEGNDYLDGGAGDDALYGYGGNDIYLFQAGENDIAIEFANEGFDIVRSYRTVSDLWFHIEGLELQGSTDLDGTGNANANNLQGNAGENRLSGLAGVDTINGNDGDDVIVGGAGNDLLRGGLGADRFVVLQESLSVTLETDQVYDFSAAEGDWIDLSGIDAKPLGADDAFTLVGAFTKHAGEMTLTFAGGITTLRLDVNGDGKVDYQMKINGDVTGESGDWVL